MDKQQIEQIVAEAAKEQRLSCSTAHQLAEQHGITLKEIGEAADRLSIKIFSCQLGCF